MKASLDADAFARALQAAECEADSPLLSLPARHSISSQATQATVATTSTEHGTHQHVQVVVRVKPLPGEDRACLEWAGDKVCVQPLDPDDDQNNVSITPARSASTGAPCMPRTPVPTSRTPSRAAPSSRKSVAATPSRSRPVLPRTFHFDAVFGEESSQPDVFAPALPLVDTVLNGGNACIFAYGQTGTGKTYTMMGTEEAPGILPRAVEHIWESIGQDQGTDRRVYLTYVELYNDGFRDLLAPSSQPGQRMLVSEQEEIRRAQSAITLRETKGVPGGPAASYLTGSASFRSAALSRSELLSLLERGHHARATANTEANEHSSRSHAIITLNIDTSTKGGAVRTGKLHLVDLAGSESLSANGEKELSGETRAINLSLTALCDVLQSLSRNARRPCGSAPKPVPFRNHKLTRLLADSLGGMSKTLMIATIQRGHQHCRSTITTLKLASRARDISVSGTVVEGGRAGKSLFGEASVESRLEELEARLKRREAEIASLESVVTSHDVQRMEAFEAKLGELREVHGVEVREYQEKLEEGEREVARARAEAAYAMALREMEGAVAEHEGRVAELEMFKLREEVEVVRRELRRSEEELVQTRGEQEAALRVFERDGEALSRALEGWRGDREELACVKSQIEQLQRTRVEMEEEERMKARELGSKEKADELLWTNLSRALRAAEEGHKEMGAVRAVLAVLGDEESVVSSSAASTLKWLQSKLGEGVRRYDVAISPFADLLGPPVPKTKGRVTRARGGEEEGRAKRSKSSRQSSKPAAGEGEVERRSSIKPSVVEVEMTPMPKRGGEVREEMPTDHLEVPMSLASLASSGGEERCMPTIKESQQAVGGEEVGSSEGVDEASSLEGEAQPSLEMAEESGQPQDKPKAQESGMSHEGVKPKAKIRPTEREEQQGKGKQRVEEKRKDNRRPDDIPKAQESCNPQESENKQGEANREVMGKLQQAAKVKESVQAKDSVKTTVGVKAAASGNALECGIAQEDPQKSGKAKAQEEGTSAGCENTHESGTLREGGKTQGEKAHVKAKAPSRGRAPHKSREGGGEAEGGYASRSKRAIRDVQRRPSVEDREREEISNRESREEGEVVEGRGASKRSRRAEQQIMQSTRAKDDPSKQVGCVNENGSQQAGGGGEREGGGGGRRTRGRSRVKEALSPLHQLPSQEGELPSVAQSKRKLFNPRVTAASLDEMPNLTF